jgi:tryptophan synthase alpha subunit
LKTDFSPQIEQIEQIDMAFRLLGIDIDDHDNLAQGNALAFAMITGSAMLAVSFTSNRSAPVLSITLIGIASTTSQSMAVVTGP